MPCLWTKRATGGKTICVHLFTSAFSIFSRYSHVSTSRIYGLGCSCFSKNGNFMSRSTIETCNTSIISFQRLHKLLHNLPYLCFLKELALLRNIKRTASVVVREDAELLVVEKDVFSKTCPKIFDKELVDKIKFCK